MNLKFYNHYGNGDLFESREFVRDWMRLAGVSSATYHHKLNPLIFSDLPQIQSLPLEPWMNPQVGLVQRKEELYVNTWVGRGWNGRDNGYVLNPGVGCVVEELFRMHNDLLREAGFPALPRTIPEYIPVIDYAGVDLGDCRQFLHRHSGKKLVLICNGKTTSHHADNFDYWKMVPLLPKRPDVAYLFTEGKTMAARPDIAVTDNITRRREWDLNAISYLSRFCSVIVGRCSGPHVFGQVLENWMDSGKSLVCFTRHRNGACFVRYPETYGLKMKVVWSPALEPKSAAKVIRECL